MKVTGAFAVKFGEEIIDVHILNFSKDQMEEISNMLQEPSRWGMKNYTDMLEKIEVTKKYFVTYKSSANNKKGSKHYQTEVMDKLFESLRGENIPTAAKISDLINEEDKKLKFDFIVYTNFDNRIETKEECSKQSALYIYETKHSSYMKNKILGIGDSTNAKAIKLVSARNSINFPYTDCVATFFIKEIISKGKKGQSELLSKVEVFNPYKFDSMFHATKTQKKYVENVIKQMLDKNKDNKLTLTNDDLSVVVPSEGDLLKEIYKKDIVLESFANFNSNKRRKIQNISSKDLSEVLDQLKKYANDNADAPFNEGNVPKLDETNETITLSPDTVIIFAALLDNKVIEQLLDHKITSPYFKEFLE